MENEKMLINSEKIVLNDTLSRIDEDIKRLKLERKDGLHLRLLAEEALGMLKLMAGDFTALLWLEREDSEASVHLTAKIDDIDIDAKKELIAVSSSGKNAAVKGLMGKIRDVFENTILNADNVMQLEQQYGMGFYDLSTAGTMYNGYSMAWSLGQYRDSVEQADQADQAVEEEVSDIFEKSIVGSIAKDVAVGVKNDTVEMIMLMDLKGE